MHQDEKETITPTIEFSRTKAASLFEPPVNVRTLQNYLELAKIFLPTFQAFEDDETGGLNRFTKVNLDHLPILQRMMDYCRSHGLRKLRIELKNHPDYFEFGDCTDGYDQNNGSTTKHPTKETAIRILEKVSGADMDAGLRNSRRI